MPRQPTPKDLRREAAEHRAEAQRILDRATSEAEPLLFLAAAKEKTAAKLEGQGESFQGHLPSGHGYDTVSPMSASPNVTATEKHPGPVAEGHLAGLLAELGMSSLAELAAAINEPYDNVRSWNSRGSVPSRARPALDKLRDERQAQRATKKRQKA